MYYIYYYAAMFGAPNNWALDSSGKLTKDIETPQYKEAMAYVRDLVAVGRLPSRRADHRRQHRRPQWPDRLEVRARRRDVRQCLAGRLDARTEAESASHSRRGLPFPAHDGGKAQHFLATATSATTTFKTAPPDRIKELLRIANWLAAPFGSAEDLLLTVGVKDVDYTLGADGSITVLPPSNTDANSVPWKYIVQRPQVAFWPGIPDYAKAATDFEKAAIAVGVADPTLGYQLGDAGQKGVPLARR